MDSLNTRLHNRVLWFDGETSLFSANVIDALFRQHGDIKKNIDSLTPDIVKYNNHVNISRQFIVKTDCNLPEIKWTFPDKYQNINILNVLMERFAEYGDSSSVDLLDKAATRFSKEYDLFLKNNCIDLLRLVHYIVETFEENNVVWGVGRGSSVSCFLFYLLQMHDIDSVEYDLDINDFFH